MVDPVEQEKLEGSGGLGIFRWESLGRLSLKTITDTCIVRGSPSIISAVANVVILLACHF